MLVYIAFVKYIDNYILIPKSRYYNIPQVDRNSPNKGGLQPALVDFFSANMRPLTTEAAHITSPLPWASRVAEVNLDVGSHRELLVGMHLRASVPGQ